MATQTVTSTVCDMPHDPDVEGTPVTFQLDGVGAFAIDLCGDCTAKFFVPVIKESRRVPYPARTSAKRIVKRRQKKTE